jgi:ABC-type antimicrobial peptide transport system permease subunit
VAAAVAALAGALLVGESVRASLRRLALERLGRTEYAITGQVFFRETMAGVPMIALESVVTHQESGRRAGKVDVLGVDERFWRFHGWPPGEEARATAALVAELGAKAGDSLLVRVEKPSAIPLESLHGRKDEQAGQTVRVTIEGTAPEFSLQPRQGSVRAVYVPLRRLQRALGQERKANVALVAGAQPDVRRLFALEDVGVHVRGQQIESDAAILSDALLGALPGSPVFTYLANTIRTAERQMPYSLVTGIETVTEGIVLNDWAARDLRVRPGARISIDYFVWLEEGRLATRTAEFTVSGIVPTKDQRELAPTYPGISDTDDLSDWDPPFPMDLARVRPIDEEYWDRYRTTPKAFVPLAEAQRLWGSRHGKATALRIEGDPAAAAARLKRALDPEKLGLSIVNVREQNLAAAQGVTDFGEYFVYFSFFLVVSALLLAGLFFKFGVEQRVREIGTLQALGFDARRIRGLFLKEGAVLSAAGAVLGMAAAVGYAAVILYGLRTWWKDAVGTELLQLEVSAAPLAAGALGGVAAALAAIAWTLRGLGRMTARGLMMGAPVAPRRSRLYGVVCAAAGLALLAVLPATGGFFAAGALLLAAALFFARAWLGEASGRVRSVARLGFRNAGHRPGRSVLCMALIASATFLVVAVDAFRKRETAAPPYPYFAESLLAIVEPAFAAVRFRLRPGDDASCLNLYQPRKPRVLGAPEEFVRTAGEPWNKLLEAPVDGAIPALADANSITYVLHRKIGDVFEAAPGVRVRLAGALRDSVFQSELVIAEEQFKRVFPEHEGYRFFLLKDAPADLEERMAAFGLDVMSTRERLATYHRVENTYLSTFQSLGAMGLLLGTVGLAVVLLRNVLERRREMALLRAVGYRSRDLSRMVFVENVFLLVCGLAAGTVCALIAIAPAFAARSGRFSWSLAALLAAVLLSGMAASWAATRAAVRANLLEALRAE